MKKAGIIGLLGCVIYSLLAFSFAYANNVKVTNVQLLGSDYLPDQLMKVQFTLSQDNPFGDLTYDGKPYSDYIWVFVKYAVLKVDGTVDETIGYKHATLQGAPSGVSDYSPATGEGVTVPDGKGAFIKASNAGVVPGKSFYLYWKYLTDGVSATDKVKIRVCAIEMVKVPGGSYYYGTGNPANNTGGNNYAIGTSYYDVNKQNIPYQGSQPGYLIDSANCVPNGATAGQWLNGYNSFYLMKYEISQGQYTDFLNMISSISASARFPNMNNNFEHTISKTTDATIPYGQRYAVFISERACNYLTWDDGMAYASWAGLRPMTEMEFEKATRGTSTDPQRNKASFAWGNTYPTKDNPLYIPGGHVYPFDAYKFYGNITERGNNIQDEDGPTNVGLYASGDITRTPEQTGNSPYGITDLSTNLAEQVINCSSVQTPSNGDGKIHTDYYTDLKWPRSDSNPTIGIGLRGSCWNWGTWSNTSNRQQAVTTWGASRMQYFGFRCARTP